VQVNVTCSDYVKFENPKLKSLITRVDSVGLAACGMDVPTPGTTEPKQAGKPGEWSIDSFLTHLRVDINKFV
jgi:hypothetical protein